MLFSSARSDLPENSKRLYSLSFIVLSRLGASSKTTCAFVPPMPNELTPAFLKLFPRVQSRNWVFTKNGLLLKSMFRFGFVKWRLGGICLFFRERTVLIKPATPAAASKCPIFVFTEPIAQNCFFFVLKALTKDETSMGSPNVVPEP